MASSTTRVATMERPPASLCALSPELVACVYGYLTPRDRARFALTCKYTASVARALHVFSNVVLWIDMGE